MAIGISLAAVVIATAPIPAANWAIAHEAAGHWDNALDLYLRLPESRRATIPDLASRIHRCIRYSAQFQRHRDPAFQAYVLSLSLADGLAVYSDVIEKLGRLYADADRVSPARLFLLGRDELAQALLNPQFVAKHLNGVDANRIQSVRTWLINFQIHPTASHREARTAVRAVAVGIRDAIPSANPSAIILEFLCGACGGLDEHTAYHPPGTLPKPTPGLTVVNAAMIDERFGVGYLRVTEFQETTASEFDAAIGLLRMRGVRAVIVDLRGNPGGLLTAGVEIARRFIPAGVIVRTSGQSPDFAGRVFESESGMAALDLPLVLLVDAGTMSAAEVVAAAVKDNARGTLVGVQTYGKGTVQVPLKTPEGKTSKSTGVLVLTVARTTSPNGRPVSGGVVPDIIERDPELQLKAATAQATAMVSMGRP